MNEAVNGTINQISSSSVEWWSSFVCSLHVALFHEGFWLVCWSVGRLRAVITLAYCGCFLKQKKMIDSKPPMKLGLYISDRQMRTTIRHYLTRSD